MIKKFITISITVLLFGLSGAYAQTSTQSKTASVALDSSSSSDAVIADLDSQVVSIEEKDGVFRGSVLLRNNMGKQNNISLGVVVFDDMHTALDAYVIKTGESLQEKEQKYYAYSYALPKSLEGHLTIVFTVESRGLLISQQILKKITVPKRGNAKLTCSLSKAVEVSAGQVPEVTCLSTGKTIDVSAVDFGYLGNRYDVQRVTVSDGKVSFIPKIPKGKHYLFISDGNEGARTGLAYNTRGEYGSIVNTLVAVKDASPAVTIFTAGSFVKGHVHVLLTNKNGITCFDKNLDLVNSVARSQVPEACKEGGAQVTLTTDSGSVLDTASSSFSMIPYKTLTETKITETEMVNSQTSKRNMVAVISFVILSLLGASILWYKKYKVKQGIVSV